MQHSFYATQKNIPKAGVNPKEAIRCYMAKVKYKNNILF